MPLKKMQETLTTLESSSNVVVYALDETSVSVESVNYYSWSPIGHPPILEKNGSHKGIRLVGSTSILNDMHTVVDVYSSQQSITSESIKSHMMHLLEINPNKKVIIVLDNAKTHKSILMENFYLDNKDRLQPIFLPKYSPMMNPQEHIWRHYKALLYRPNARKNIYELTADSKLIFDELNSNKDKLYSLAYAKKYLL